MFWSRKKRCFWLGDPEESVDGCQVSSHGSSILWIAPWLWLVFLPSWTLRGATEFWDHIHGCIFVHAKHKALRFWGIEMRQTCGTKGQRKPPSKCWLKTCFTMQRTLATGCVCVCKTDRDREVCLSMWYLNGTYVWKYMSLNVHIMNVWIYLYECVCRCIR